MGETSNESNRRKVEEIILQEALWRREEANSALANLYLRGTVLMALAISEIGLVASSPGRPEVVLSLLVALSVASILGLVAFWPRRKQKFKLTAIRQTLNEDANNATRGYLEFVQADYVEVEAAISRRTTTIKIGYLVCVVALPVLFFVLMGARN